MTLRGLPDDELVCYCSQVSKGAIKKAVQSGVGSLKALQESTQAGVGNQCKELNPSGHCCHSDLKTLIEIYGHPQHDDNSGKCCSQKQIEI